MLLLVFPSLYLHRRSVSNSKFLPWQPRKDLFLLVQTLEVLTGGRKGEGDNCHWSKFSWEEKNHSAPNLYHCWFMTQLENSCAPSCTEPLRWTRGVKLCPVFSLKAQRSAVSKLLMLPLSSLCVVSAGNMIRVTTNHPLGTCGACSAPVLQPWLILCAAAAGSWTVLYCQKFSTRLRTSALPFIDREGHVFFREMHACCSSREHAEHAGLMKSLWEGISVLTQVL